MKSHRVLQCYRAWKEAAGLLSLIHLQRQEVAPDANEPAGVHSRQGGWYILSTSGRELLVTFRFSLGIPKEYGGARLCATAV